MTPRKTLMAQLAEREQQVAAAHAKVAEIEEQARQATAEAARSREALVEAYASGDAAQAEKLVQAKVGAEAVAGEPWRERVDGSKRAANRMQAEVDGWRIQNVRQLLDEVAPDAHGAAEAILTAVAAVEEARRHWHEVATRVASLVRDVPDTHPRAVPNLDGPDAAIRQLKRDLGEVPPPLPRWAAVATVAPEHDPDERVRAVARQEIREKSGRGPE